MRTFVCNVYFPHPLIPMRTFVFNMYFSYPLILKRTSVFNVYFPYSLIPVRIYAFEVYFPHLLIPVKTYDCNVNFPCPLIPVKTYVFKRYRMITVPLVYLSHNWIIQSIYLCGYASLDKYLLHTFDLWREYFTIEHNIIFMFVQVNDLI